MVHAFRTYNRFSPDRLLVVEGGAEFVDGMFEHAKKPDAYVWD